MHRLALRLGAPASTWSGTLGASAETHVVMRSPAPNRHCIATAPCTETRAPPTANVLPPAPSPPSFSLVARFFPARHLHYHPRPPTPPPADRLPARVASDTWQGWLGFSEPRLQPSPPACDLPARLHTAPSPALPGLPLALASNTPSTCAPAHLRCPSPLPSSTSILVEPSVSPSPSHLFPVSGHINILYVRSNPSRLGP